MELELCNNSDNEDAVSKLDDCDEETNQCSMKNDEDKRLEKKKRTRLLLQHNTLIMEADAGKLELI